MTDRRKWVCISSYDCSFMFCRFLTFSDGALYYEVGSTTCGLTGTYLKTFFMNFNKIFKTMWNAYFSCSKQTFYIIRMPISYSRQRTCLFSSIHHYIIFLWLQRSIGQPKVFFYKFQKIIIKKRITQKKNNKSAVSYLIISIS